MLGQTFAAKWTEVDGIRTRYFEAGAGEPILLLHGGTIGDDASCNAEEWDLNFPALVAAGYRVVAIDKLGQGATDNPARDADYSLRGQVAHALAFLAQRPDMQPCHLIGHSRGGYVACRILMERPDLARSCVIIDSNTAAPGPGKNEIVFSGNPYPQGSRESCTWSLERFSHGRDHVTPAWIDTVHGFVSLDKNKIAVRKMRAEGLAETIFSPTLFEDRAQLFAMLRERDVARPILLVWAFNDPTATIEQGYAFFDCLSQRQTRTQMHVINEAGHFCHREQPAAFNRAVLAFLETCGVD